MKKFNVLDILNSNSQSLNTDDVNKENDIVMIDVFDIEESKSNFYATDEIDDLADSIEMIGLQQNLVVKKKDNCKHKIIFNQRIRLMVLRLAAQSKEKLGTRKTLVVNKNKKCKYKAIAGHRRRLACMKLVSQGKEKFRYVPCIIESSKDDIRQKLILILTNSTTRVISDYEKVEQSRQLKELLIEYKKDHKIPGRVRDLIADTLNTSPTQVARMDSISNNLSDDLKKEFKEEKINISTAYEISGLGLEQQKDVYIQAKEKETNDGLFSISLKEIKELKKETEKDVLDKVMDETVDQELDITTFEKNGEAYGATWNEIIVSLVKEMVEMDMGIEDIDGICCHAFGFNYYAYNIENDEYITIESVDEKPVFRTSIERFQGEYEWHKTRLATLSKVKQENKGPENMNNNQEPKNEVKENVTVDVIQSITKKEVDHEDEGIELIQPVLQILKNNDQRKEFIENYTSWPVWIDIGQTGERYYRYNLTEKVAIVVKVSRKHSWKQHRETKDYEYGAEQYYLLGVKSEWHSGKNIYREDDTRTFYECNTNKSALVDYLKEFQKKGA